MANGHDTQLDSDLTPEQEAVAASLTAEQLALIDAALLRACRTSSRKLAMVVATAMDDLPFEFDALPDVFYTRRVSALVASGQLEALGDLRRMRYSEVRLPAPGRSGGT